MGGALDTQEGREKCVQAFGGETRRIRRQRFTCEVDIKMHYRLDLLGLEYGHVAGAFGYNDEISGFCGICVKCLDKPRTC
jgi:hypothetical protein